MSGHNPRSIIWDHKDEIFNLVDSGKTIHEVAMMFKVCARTIKVFLNVGGDITRLRKEKQPQNAYLLSKGYTPAEAERIRKYMVKYPYGNLLSIIEYRCTDEKICYPCYLNNRRKLVDNT